MSSEWPNVRLGDHVNSCLGKMLDKKKNKGTKQPYLGNSNVRWGEFDLSELSDMKFEEHEFERYGIKAGDLIICEGGEPGRCAIWNEEFPNMKIQKALHRIRVNQTINNQFLYYWFLHAGRNGLLEPYFTGTTIKHLTGKALNNLELKLPPREHQDYMGRMLGDIDQKIQTNKKINQILEQMVQAIFKSWFVDFEPVKAKIAALEAGGSEKDAVLAAMQIISGKNEEQLALLQEEKPDRYAELLTTAELFPSSMRDSELGEIPEGWECGTFATISELNKNSWTKRTIPAKIEYVDLANTKNGIIESTTEFASEDAPSRARRILTEGDTIIGTVRPGNRSFAFINNPSDILTGSTGFAVLSPKRKVFAEFIYIAASSDETIKHFAHIADGGAYPAIRAELISQRATIIPNDRTIERFHEIVAPFFEQSALGKLESTLLKNARDTLLPKLLSGELSNSKTSGNQTKTEPLKEYS